MDTLTTQGQPPVPGHPPDAPMQAPPARSRPPHRRWSRDGRLWLVVAFLVYTAFGFLGVPWILRSQVPRQVRAALGREASLASASFNPFTFRAVLRGFEVRDRDASPLAGFDELDVNLRLSGLFRRAWAFSEVRLVRPRGMVRFLPDGRLAVADLLEGEPEPPGEQPTALPRLLVDDLRIEGGRLEFRDESVAPPFATAFDPLALEVTGLSTLPDERGDHVVTVGLENGQVRWTGTMSVEPLRLAGRFEVSLTEFRRLAEYVAHAFPVRMRSGPVELVLPYAVEKAAGGPLTFALQDVAGSVADLDLRPAQGEAEGLHLARVEVQGARVRWPERAAGADLVRVTGPTLKTWIAEDGTFGGVEFLAAAPSAPATPAAATAPAPPWTVTCGAVEVAGGAFELQDRTVVPPATVALTALSARLEGLSSDLAAAVPLQASAAVNGAGRLSMQGRVAWSPLDLRADVDASGLDAVPFQGYASGIARVEVRSGAAGFKGALAVKPDAQPSFSFAGRATLDGLSLAGPDGQRVLAWDGLSAEDLRLELGPDRLRARAVEVRNPFAQILIDKQGTLGLAALFGPEGEGAAPPAGDAAFPFDIGTVRLAGAVVDYGDQSLILPFRTRIHSAQGRLTDLSSTGAAGSQLSFEGKVDEFGYAKAEGSLRLSDPYAASEVRVLFRNVDMKNLTPYTAEFAGYAIEDGRLDLAVDYAIRERALVGNHRMTATALSLGGKVDGAPASLPLRLAVALLKDKDGKIELDVPIEGSVDDPEFAYRKVIWSAFKRILVNVTTAPFRFLGRLVGIEGDDLEFVAFEAGRSALLPPEREKLGKLVEGLRSRPELSLTVGGRFDPASDAAALRADKLEALLAARREATGGAPIEGILEALYSEAFGAPSLDALRARHTTPAPPPAVPPKKKEPPPAPVLDAPAFYEAIRRELLAAQTAGPEELDALARARSEAIVSALTAEGGIEPARVSPTPVEPVKKKKAGSELVPCELAMPAE